MPVWSNLREMSRTMSISFMTSRYQMSLFSGALAEELGNIEIDEVSVMKDDRFDRALDLVAFMTMRCDNVHDFARNAVLVGERDAAEWMPHLLSKFSLNHVAESVLIKLQGFAHISQERTGDKVIALNRDPAAERTLQHIRNRDALERAGIKMFDEL